MADKQWMKVTFDAYGDPDIVRGTDPLEFFSRVERGELFERINSLCVEAIEVPFVSAVD